MEIYWELQISTSCGYFTCIAKRARIQQNYFLHQRYQTFKSQNRCLNQFGLIDLIALV